jgi:hypothetical protein
MNNLQSTFTQITHTTGYDVAMQYSILANIINKSRFKNNIIIGPLVLAIKNKVTSAYLSTNQAQDVIDRIVQTNYSDDFRRFEYLSHDDSTDAEEHEFCFFVPIPLQPKIMHPQNDNLLSSFKRQYHQDYHKAFLEMYYYPHPTSAAAFVLQSE